MRCKRCGAAVKPRSGFCQVCGANVGRPPKGTVRCRRCGRRVPASGRLCPACGAELRRSWRAVYLSVLCLLLVGGCYYLVADVITVARIREEVQALSQSSLTSLLPQTPATLTPPPPTGTRTTPTRIPTATPATPTATPSQAPTETPSPGSTAPAASPVPAPSATFAFGAIELVGPPNAAVVQGDSVVLSWRPQAALAVDSVYVVTLRYVASGREQSVTAWTREAAWTVPAELRQKADPASREFRWSVQIMGRTADGSGGGEGIALSPPSETRTFVWP